MRKIYYFLDRRMKMGVDTDSEGPVDGASEIESIIDVPVRRI